MTELPINQVLCGAFPAATHSWPDEIINLVMFSPPYWGLRDYGEATNTVWGGDPGCEHEWGDEQPHGSRGNRGGSGTNPKEMTFAGNSSSGQFCSKCGVWYGQLGLEPDFKMYVAHLVEVGREIKRILRKDGSWYLNLGDTYFGDSKVRTKGSEAFERAGDKGYEDWLADNRESTGKVRRSAESQGPKAKCKLLIPYRVALALIDDGWICRNDITWHKGNAMPSSKKDALTPTTERVFHLVKSNCATIWMNKTNRKWQTEKPRVDDRITCTNCNGTGQDVIRKEPCRCIKTKFPLTEWAWRGFDYYYDLDAIREPHKTEGCWGKPHQKGSNSPAALDKRGYLGGGFSGGDSRVFQHPLGKNPGDFWGINTRPFPEAHFAVYPEELCVRPIKSSCPPNGIVLDPMCGAGTTLKEAKRLGRRYIGIDIKPKYVEMTKRGLSQVEWPLEAYSL